MGEFYFVLSLFSGEIDGFQQQNFYDVVQPSFASQSSESRTKQRSLSTSSPSPSGIPYVVKPRANTIAEVQPAPRSPFNGSSRLENFPKVLKSLETPEGRRPSLPIQGQNDIGTRWGKFRKDSCPEFRGSFVVQNRNFMRSFQEEAMGESEFEEEEQYLSPSEIKSPNQSHRKKSFQNPRNSAHKMVDSMEDEESISEGLPKCVGAEEKSLSLNDKARSSEKTLPMSFDQTEMDVEEEADGLEKETADCYAVMKA